MKVKQVCILAVLLAGVVVSAQVSPIAAVKELPGHPRILLLSGEEASIRKYLSDNDTWRQVHQTILSGCERMMAQPPIERIQIGRRLLDKSRECLRRVFYLSYAWRMTREEKYLQRAEKELLAVSAFTDWNPSHFLDVAEMTLAVAIGYDWLYGALPESSRVRIREAILEKGIRPSLDSRHNGWLKASHNWNQVCNTGMTFGALAVFEDQPKLAGQIIDRAIESITLPMEDYNPDGAYPEGYSYWGYGTGFHVLFLSAMEKIFGKDLDLSPKPGFLKTAGYLENMTGPTHNSFNYSDCGPGSSLHPAMFWFAGKLNNPSLLWVERSHLAREDERERGTDRLLPAVILWGAGTDLRRITEPKEKVWVGQGKNPVALMRSSWSDPDALFIGIKGGSPAVNHAHMDIGSFVMEAEGVRWAMDFGSENYHTLESNGINLWGKEQDSERWKVFRYNNFVHNTLTINNALQRVDGYAPITAFSSNPAFMKAVVDLSAVYRGTAASVKRGIAIVDRRYVLVRDEMEIPDQSQDSTVRWTLLTSAAVQITGKGEAQLTQNGKKLRIHVAEPEMVSLQTWPTLPSRSYENSNKGTVLLGFEARLAPKTKHALTVLLIPQSAGKRVMEKVGPISSWP